MLRREAGCVRCAATIAPRVGSPGRRGALSALVVAHCARDGRRDARSQARRLVRLFLGGAPAASNAKSIDELCAELAAGEQIQAQSLYVLTNVRFPHQVIGAASQAGNLGRRRGPNVEKRTVPLLDVGARAVQQHHLDQLHFLHDTVGRQPPWRLCRGYGLVLWKRWRRRSASRAPLGALTEASPPPIGRVIRVERPTIEPDVGAVAAKSRRTASCCHDTACRATGADRARIC